MKKVLAAHILLLCLFRSPIIKQISLNSPTLSRSVSLDSNELENDASIDYLASNAVAKHDLDLMPDVSKFYSHPFSFPTVPGVDFWALILDAWRRGSQSIQGSSSNGILSDITGTNGLSTADIEAIQYSYKEDELLTTNPYCYHQPQTVELPCSSFDSSYKENFQHETYPGSKFTQPYEEATCAANYNYQKSFSVDKLEPSLKDNVFLFDIDHLLAANESSDDVHEPRGSNFELASGTNEQLLLNQSVAELQNVAGQAEGEYDSGIGQSASEFQADQSGADFDSDEWLFDFFEPEVVSSETDNSVSSHSYQPTEIHEMADGEFDTLERIPHINSESLFGTGNNFRESSYQQHETHQAANNHHFYLTSTNPTQTIQTTSQNARYLSLEQPTNAPAFTSSSAPTQAFSSHVTQQTTETYNTPTSSQSNDCAFCQHASSLTSCSQDVKCSETKKVNASASNHTYIRQSNDGSNEPWTNGAFASLVEVTPIKVEESTASRSQPTSSTGDVQPTPVVRKTTRRSASATSDNRRQEEEVLNLLAPRGVNRDHVVNCVLDDFHRVVAVLKTEEHRQVLKEIRKRGRNKLAAKRVRSKTANKLDETRADIDALKARREELIEERKRLIERINRQRQEYEELTSTRRSTLD